MNNGSKRSKKKIDLRYKIIFCILNHIASKRNLVYAEVHH